MDGTCRFPSCDSFGFHAYLLLGSQACDNDAPQRPHEDGLVRLEISFAFALEYLENAPTGGLGEDSISRFEENRDLQLPIPWRIHDRDQNKS